MRIAPAKHTALRHLTVAHVSTFIARVVDKFKLRLMVDVTAHTAKPEQQAGADDRGLDFHVKVITRSATPGQIIIG